jgi:hypothetical protein
LSGGRQPRDVDSSSSIAALALSVLELIRPRIHWVPECEEAFGDGAVEFARRVGLTLDPEQEMVLAESLGIREDGRWQTREVGVNMPRQNGKGEILIARELFGLFELRERLVIHTAHEFKTSAEHFNRLEAVVRECPELHDQVKRKSTGTVIGYRYSHGEESIELQDGRRIEFKTRTKSGMRGFAGVDCLVLDEAMIISDAAHQSALPIIRSSKAERGPQVWYAGSAVDQEIHDHGVVWTRVRERGIAGDDQSLAYIEWSLDFEHPDDVPDVVADDPENWRAVNFAIAHGRILEEHMAWERRALSDRAFKVELLGVGDPPPTDGSADVLISQEAWAEVLDSTAVMVDPVCLAWDVSPERHSAIVAAGRDERGHWLVEVIHARSGTGWLVERLIDLYEKHEIAEVVCDGFGPAAAIANRVDEAGIKVKRMDSGDYGKACGLFVDCVGEKTLRHLGQEELDSAIRGARARPLVDRWAWSRTKSSMNISPLVAATLALWSAVENNVGTVEIY